jgi:hypothetical protein
MVLDTRAAAEPNASSVRLWLLPAQRSLFLVLGIEASRTFRSRPLRSAFLLSRGSAAMYADGHEPNTLLEPLTVAISQTLSTVRVEETGPLSGVTTVLLQE